MMATMNLPSTLAAKQQTAAQKPTLERLPNAANTHGVEYEWKVAALLALRAYRRGLPFQMFTNVKAARPCDDLVLRLQDPHEGELTYYLQLKHSDNAAKLTEQALAAMKGDFCISKYFEFFEKLKDWYSKPKTNLSADELWLTQTPLSNVRFVLLTTKNVERRTSVDEEFHHAQLFATGAGPALSDTVQLHSVYTKVWQLFANDPQRQQVFQQEFLPRLRLLRCQAPVQQLDAHIAYEMHEMFGHQMWMQPDILLHFIRSWAEGTEGACVSADELICLFQQQLQQRATKLIGNFIFKKESLNTLRKAVFPSDALLCSSSAAPSSSSTAPAMSSACARSVRVSVRGVPEPGRRAAKLLQLLQEDFKEDWLYVDSTVLKAVPTPSITAAIFRGRVLVMDLKDEGRDIDLLRVLQNAVNHRVVEVALHAEGDGTSDFTDEWRLSNLQQEAQDELMQREIYFQGHLMKLEGVLGIWPSLHDDVTANFMLLLDGNQKPKIGKEVTNVKHALFIPRRFSHNSVVSAEVLSSSEEGNYFLALEGFPEKVLECAAGYLKISKSDIKENQSWKVVNFVKTIETIGDELYQIYQENKRRSVHWIKYCSGESTKNLILLWRGTVGDTEPITKMVKKLSNCCSLEPECVHSTFRPWSFERTLLVGEAGVGKSITLGKLSLKTKNDRPYEWIILLKILDYRRTLRNCPKSTELSWENVLDLLSEAAVGKDVGVEAMMGRRCLESSLRSGGKVCVFLDGADEVAPAFEEKVIRMLELLREHPNISLCVSTRPEVEASLQSALQCPSLYLQPFSEEEQKQYLYCYWNSQRLERQCGHEEEEKEEDEEKARSLLQILTNETGGLQTTPLHLQMAAEVFSERKSLQQSINILNLYELFIEKRKYNLLERYNIVNENQMFEDFEMLHQECAMTFLFVDSSNKKIFKFDNIEKKIRKNEKILKEKLKTGILWINEDGRFNFAHQSFAEFFAAKWLWREVESSDSVQQYVLDVVRKAVNERERLRRFLLLMLAEKSPLHAFAWLISYDFDYFHVVTPLLENVQEIDWEHRDCLSKLTTEEILRTELGKKLSLEAGVIKCHQPWLADALLTTANFGLTGVFKELLRHASAVDANHSQGITNALRRELLPILNPFVLNEALKAFAEGQSDRHTTIVKLLLEHGAEDRADSLGTTALHLAARYGNIATVKLLLQRTTSTEFNTGDLIAYTPLHWAIKGNYFEPKHDHEKSQLLIQLPDIDLNRKGLKEVTPLDCAFEVRCEDCSLAILQRGAEVTDRHLVAATEKNCVNALSYLLTQGADPNVTREDGDTLLHIAVRLNSTEAVECLIKHKAQVNSTNNRRDTPLHIAAQKGSVEIITKLIENGADVNAVNSYGNTSLHLASWTEAVKAISQLIENGADVNAVNRKGVTPKTIARKLKNSDAKRLFGNEI